MRALLARFGLILFWCWLLIFVGIDLFVLVAVTGPGQSIEFASSGTWVAFALCSLIAFLFSIVPAVLLAAMVAAALFKQRATASGLTCASIDTAPRIRRGQA